MSVSSDSDALYIDESGADDTNESSDLLDSEVPRKCDQPNISNDENYLEIERKLVSDNNNHTGVHPEKVAESYSEEVDTIKIGSILETERKLVSNSNDCIEVHSEKVAAAESSSEKVSQFDFGSNEIISDTEIKLVSDSAARNAVSASESDIGNNNKTESGNIKNISECERNIFSMTFPGEGSDSNFEKEVKSAIKSPNASTVKRKVDCEGKYLSPGCSKDSYLLESPKKVARSISMDSDVKTEVSPKLEAREPLDLSSRRQEIDSTIEDIALPNVDQIRKFEVCETSDETRKKSDNSGKAQTFHQADCGISNPEKKLNLLKLYQIQKWLKGITDELYGRTRAVQTSPSNTSKRKFEEKDPVPGCSKDADPSVSPNKVLKSPKERHINLISSKTGVTKPDDEPIYTCNVCFQIFINRRGLEEHKTSCYWSLEPGEKIDSNSADPFQTSVLRITKEFPSLSSTSNPTWGEKLPTPSSQKLEFAKELVFTCPDCGCVLSRENIEVCYSHALTCFFANPENHIPKREDTLDSEGNYSITDSENTNKSEFLYNLLNYYMVDFIKSTVSDSSDENKSPDPYFNDCPICSRRLVNQSLRDHIKSVHVASKFSAKDAARELAADASKHGFVKGNVFKCKRCGAKFSSCEGLKLHIDAYITGDCCPESSFISESASFEIENIGSESSNIEKNAKQTNESANKDFYPRSSQTADPIEQSSHLDSIGRDSYPRSLQIAESDEQNSVCESGSRDCGLDYSQIKLSRERPSGCELKQEGSVNKSSNVKLMGTETASNCQGHTAYTCRFCFYACENLDDMIEHYSIHELLRACYQHDASPDETHSDHQCPDCLKLFGDLDSAIDHIHLVYRRPNTCLVCHEFFRSFTCYDNHLQEHILDLIKVYRDSRSNEQNDMTNSTDDKNTTENTPERRRRRSKKNQDNKTSNKSPLTQQAINLPYNVPKVEILRSTLDPSKELPCDQRSLIRDHSYEIDKAEEKILEEHRSEANASNPNNSQPPEFEKGESKNGFSVQEGHKQLEPGGTRLDFEKDLEESIPSLQNLSSPETPEVALINKSCDQGDNKNEESGQKNEESKEHTFMGDSVSSTQLDFSAFTSSDQEHSQESNVEDEGSKRYRKEFTPVLSLIPQIHSLEAPSPHQGDMVKKENEKAIEDSYREAPSPHQGDMVKKENEKAIEESCGEAPSPHQGDMVKKENEKAIEDSYREAPSPHQGDMIKKENEKAIEDSYREAPSPHQGDMVKKEKAIEDTDRNLEELISGSQNPHSPSNRQVVSDISSDQDSYVPSINLPESVSVTASSSVPQIIVTYISDQEDSVGEDHKKATGGSGRNIEDRKYVSQNTPFSPLTLTKRIAMVENYDADVSAGASSDDQEVVQIHASGTYVVRTKKSVPAGENSSRCCRECNVTFGSASNFVAHNLMHSIFLCLKCNERFSMKSSFMDHLVRHTGRKPYACFYCWMSFATRIDLKIHEKCCGARKRSLQTME